MTGYSVSTVTKSYDGQQTITTVTRVQQTFVNQNGDGKTNSTDNTTTQSVDQPAVEQPVSTDVPVLVPA